MGRRKAAGGFGQEQEFELPEVLLGLRGLFGAEERARGARGFRRGWVQQIVHQGGRFEALVLDRQSCRCTFELQGPTRLTCSCTCPKGEAGGRCNHVWAALLQAAEKGLLEERMAIAPEGESRQQLIEDVFSERLAVLLELTRERQPSPFRAGFERSPGQLGFGLSQQRLQHEGRLEVLAALSPALEQSPPSWQRINAWKARAACVGPARALGTWLLAEQPPAVPADPHSNLTLTRVAWPNEAEAIAPLLLGGVQLLLHAPEQPLRPIAARPEPWRFETAIEVGAHGRMLVGYAVVGDERRPLHSPAGRFAARWYQPGAQLPKFYRGADAPSDGPLAIGQGGWLLYPDAFGRLDAGARMPLAMDLILSGPLELPAEEAPLQHEALVALGALPRTGHSARGPRPVPVLRIETGKRGRIDVELADGKLRRALLGKPTNSTPDASAIPLDPEFERGLAERLIELGFGLAEDPLHGDSVLGPTTAPSKALAALTAEGWRIELNGEPVQWAGPFSGQVHTTPDGIVFAGGWAAGDRWIDIRELLRQDPNKLHVIDMGAGTLVLLPPDAHQRFAWIRLGALDEQQGLRFERSQAWLVELLVGQREDIELDTDFKNLRRQLRAFERPEPLPSPQGFGTELRPYQADSLGWLEALYQLGLGGCLADDMGLGKTVQVLAALERTRQARSLGGAHGLPGIAAPAGPVAASLSAKRVSKGRLAREARRSTGRSAKPQLEQPAAPPTPTGPAPSLVVAPRSVLFNWLAEARRFAPQLVVAGHHGQERWKAFEQTRKADLIVTSYATLRQDIEKFRALSFDRVILDEAQAIKNPGSQIAQAVKLLRARQRLALTGTPVENRSADLWSIFDFVNPGMLGKVSAFESLLCIDPQPGAGPAGHAELAIVGRAVRPFFLRRTKSQVLEELPAKTEQTLWVELGPAQRQSYTALLAEIRGRLIGKEVNSRDQGKHRLAILTALLRLRQCALHPGLLEDCVPEAGSAKFDELLERLEIAVAEGHKALVFSQFTSLLALLRPRLEAAGLAYGYLDGSTVDREAVVRSFEADGGPPLCLLSLKAGGSGLNLTAADYVFLLDPWWNPAVEAQAIGRAHRMGQKRAVSAYRIVARDTIEERILELQSHKTELANALFDDSNASIGNLSREDLEALLS